ncbi:MAG: hypothetical protein HY675_10945 [Chloroflexi bacterium]|nr:hypothetical protein [Chloroflexota bacterium]
MPSSAICSSLVITSTSKGLLARYSSLVVLMKPSPKYQPQTAAETLRLIISGVGPWLALGQFVDDWRGTDPARRHLLVDEAPPDVSPEYLRWAALLAAAVDWLCAHEPLPAPTWTSRPEYRLPEPWFLYPGWRLRAWQLAETPVPFRMRNIFGGDRILSRV